MFKLTHFFRQVLLDLLASVRFKLNEGCPAELKLASWYEAILDKQMQSRRKAGVQEIACQVFWEPYDTDHR